MACERCLSRRAFLAASAAAAAAAAVAASGCGNGQFGPPLASGPDAEAPTSGSLTIKLADFPALATVGTAVAFDQSERAVVRTGSSTFLGLSMICTHEQCTTQLSNNEFDCPCHGSRFSNTGDVLNGPAAQPLEHRTVTDNGDGTITIA